MRTTRTSSRAATPASADPDKVVVNKTKFRAIHADSNALWLVVGARGRDTYDCVIVKEGEFSDYDGTRKVFGGEEIRRSIKMEQFWNKSFSDSDTWYNQLPLGAIVHYNNGFKNFVRCEVVRGTTVHTGDAIVTCLKPIALVGEWREYDLPRRLPTGELVKGYHAERIEKGETFRPHTSSIYEGSTEPARFGLDPRNLPALNLTVPEATTEEVEKLRLNTAIREIADACRIGENPAATLDKILAMATAARSK